MNIIYIPKEKAENMKEYNTNYQLMINGDISIKEWKILCLKYLENLMEKSQDILKRMKDEKKFLKIEAYASIFKSNCL